MYFFFQNIRFFIFNLFFFFIRSRHILPHDKQLKPTNQKVDLKKLAACQNILLESSQCTPLKDQEMQKLTILFQGIIEITKENTIKRANTIIISIPNITENQKDTLSQLPKNHRMDIDYDENKNLVLIFIQISDLPKVDEESHNPLTID